CRRPRRLPARPEAPRAARSPAESSLRVARRTRARGAGSARAAGHAPLGLASGSALAHRNAAPGDRVTREEILTSVTAASGARNAREARGDFPRAARKYVGTVRRAGYVPPTNHTACRAHTTSSTRDGHAGRGSARVPARPRTGPGDRRAAMTRV